MRRPKGCTHSTCEGGECRKCPWNPQFDYCGFHLSSPRGEVRHPGWLIFAIGIPAGLVMTTLSRSGSYATGFVLLVTGGLAFLLARWLVQPAEETSPENPTTQNTE